LLTFSFHFISKWFDVLGQRAAVNLVPSIQLVPANKKFVFDGNRCAVPETNLQFAGLT
jgi:hypothetical protein